MFLFCWAVLLSSTVHDLFLRSLLFYSLVWKHFQPSEVPNVYKNKFYFMNCFKIRHFSYFVSKVKIFSSLSTPYRGLCDDKLTYYLSRVLFTSLVYHSRSKGESMVFSTTFFCTLEPPAMDFFSWAAVSTGAGLFLLEVSISFSHSKTKG